jgi:hypothetical protein
MHAFSNSIDIMFKRRSIWFPFGIVMLGIGIINFYNPLYTFVFGLGGIDFSNIVNFLNLLTHLFGSPVSIVKTVLIIIGVMLVASFICAIFFSGSFNVINKTMEGRQKAQGDFSEGLKKYYFKTVFVLFRVLFFGLLFLLFLMVVSVPAIVITKAWISGKAGLMVSALVLDFLTLVVLFFLAIFFTTYILFWFPALVNSGEKSFSYGKHVADTMFWKIAGRVILIILVFVVYQGLMLAADRILVGTDPDTTFVSFILFIVNLFLNTVFSSFLATYVFYIFKYITASKNNRITA